MDFEPVLVNGQKFEVKIHRSRLRQGHARAENGQIIIDVPQFLSGRYGYEMAESLYRRIKKGLEKNPDRFLHEEMRFSQGDFELLGEKFSVEVIESNRGSKSARARLIREGLSNKILVYVGESGLILEDPAAQRLVGRVVGRALLPKIESRISEINKLYFTSWIKSVRIGNARSHWGVTTEDNTITLSTRLLCMPQEIIDYVLVHELAHTKVRGHSERFWKLVARAMPDYRERKRWLRENSNKQIRAFNQQNNLAVMNQL